jgi:DNA invertase Pin-like site-specific DNA recombinase
VKIKQVHNAPSPLPKAKRVAAYARVSCGTEAMLHSMSAQISYYSEYIANNSEWEYAGVFVDEALTGTKDNRPGFQKMLSEARAGNISLIITKSISRFARNTLTVLESVRELKAIGVDIFFEEQNIHSLSAEGEVMLSILASYAQEESRSVSENIKWRVRNDFKAGKINYLRMLGYHFVDGIITIIPEEADLVRGIFTDYLDGMGITAIMKKYHKQGITLSQGKISGMLRNEKYAGDMLLQKSFISDHISKKKLMNTGQLPQYYIQDHHVAIIPKPMFEAVQAEILRRSKKHKPKTNLVQTYPFTSLIRCGKCGVHYRRKHTNAGTKYEKVVWICDTFNTLGKDECDSQQIPEDILTAKTLEILAIDEFCETTLRTCISEIRVPEHNRLIFIFADGHEVSVDWENPSRRESWTPEMKAAARQKALEVHKSRRENDSNE